GVMDWNTLNALANYSIAKNVTLPTEYDADEGGFYIMTSAGFNPGGGAAAMARMSYYLTYQTKNVMEYQDLDPKKKDQENYNDHPDTDLREQKLAGMMSDYGCGHVTVKDRKDIYIDGQKLLSVDWTGDGYDNTTENAYYVAGAIAKVFHDYDSAAGWNFRTKSGGLVTCLDDSRVNETLHAFLDSERAGERLRELVTSAYAAEAENGARAKMKAAEAKRRARLQQARASVIHADGKAVKKMRENSDAYSDYGQAEKAMFEITRVFAAQNPENEAENYAVRGRAKAVGCDFAGALQDCDKAVAMDAKNVFNFLNRADVYRMMGDNDKALADLAMAKKVKADNPYGWLISAEIYDELGRKDEAQENYQKLYALDNKYVRVIPDDYLAPINEKEYKKRLKDKAEARKQYEKKWKEEKKNADKKSAVRKTADKKDGKKN
ncbi:MAG: peptidase M48, partial [Selenomonas sp.]|nr:peptidase M48 [Selenomonas sp.]